MTKDEMEELGRKATKLLHERLGYERTGDALVNSIVTLLVTMDRIDTGNIARAECFATLAYLMGEHLCAKGAGRRLGAEPKRKRVMAIGELLRDAADKYDLLALGDGSKAKVG